MKTLLRLLLFTLIVSSAPAMAQYSFVIGGTFDAGTTPHTAGKLAVLIPLGDSGRAFSYTSLDIRGIAPGQIPAYVTQTGIAILLFCQGRLCVYSNGQGGAAATASATSGAVSGGFFPTIKIKKNISLVGQVNGLFAPAAGGPKPVWSLGLLVTP